MQLYIISDYYDVASYVVGPSDFNFKEELKRFIEKNKVPSDYACNEFIKHLINNCGFKSKSKPVEFDVGNTLESMNL